MTPSLPLDARRGLVVGDSYADAAWWRDVVVTRAITVDAELILQLGDFGLWPHGRFEDSVENLADRSGVPVWFLDGNPDDHARPDSLERDPVTRLAAVADGVWHVGEGARWVWHGLRFAAIGGAVSVDQGFRGAGVDWLPQEHVSSVDVDVAIAAGPPDWLFAHDCPLGLEPPSTDGFAIPEYIDAMARDTCRELRRAVVSMGVTRVVHGHWHIWQDRVGRLTEGRQLHVTGIACNRMAGALMALLLGGGRPAQIDPWPEPAALR